ncbi:MAG: Crp/Fnr family transcriptional regulator [Acidocella sp.]|nr:Crp/Fnr family transcriptional regulator [Acidocella sp.]
MSMALNFLIEGLAGRECEFSAGQTLFGLGDAVREVHFVRRGVIHLLRYRSDGAALILQRASAGAMLAEASVYSDTYHCDACAPDGAVTFAVARSDLRGRLDANPQACQALAQHLAHEVQRARLQAEILSLKTVQARLDAWLVWNGALPPKGQWRRLAGEIGVSPEALYREIAQRG